MLTNRKIIKIHLAKLGIIKSTIIIIVLAKRKSVRKELKNKPGGDILHF